MKFNNDKVVDAFLDSISDSVTLGVRRAYKHVESPHPDSVADNVVNEVESCLYDWLELRTTKELMEEDDV